jgi:hypothetical protein
MHGVTHIKNVIWIFRVSFALTQTKVVWRLRDIIGSAKEKVAFEIWEDLYVAHSIYWSARVVMMFIKASVIRMSHYCPQMHRDMYDKNFKFCDWYVYTC